MNSPKFSPALSPISNRYGAFETQCVRNMALATVRQNRLYRIETSVLDDTDPGSSRLYATSIMAEQFRTNKLDYMTVLRAQAMAERSFYLGYRALEGFRRQHPNRRREAAPSVIEIEATNPATIAARPVRRPAHFDTIRHKTEPVAGANADFAKRSRSTDN